MFSQGAGVYDTSMRYSIEQIAQALGARAQGNADLKVAAPREPSVAGPDDLALAMDKKFADALSNGKARAAVLWDGADWQALGLEAAIFVTRPRFAMAGVTGHFAIPRDPGDGVHQSAIIDPGAQLPADARIGPFVMIDAGVRIGDGAKIFSHVTIATGARIGRNCLIYEGARIGPDVVIGDNVIIHPNAVIGTDGFSFVTPEAGAIDAFKAGADEIAPQKSQDFARIASLGSVHIGDDVEIGAGATLDRGTIRDTVIGRGSKIDNMVHIGHNVQVGETCLLCGQVGIAGSSQIGDRVVLGGQVGVADHVTIGSDTMVAGKSGVSSNVPPNRVMMGNPAIPMTSNVESYKLYRRLPRLATKVADLQKTVSKLSSSE